MPDTKHHLTIPNPSVPVQYSTRTRTKVRIFVASPGDVLEERNRLARVVEELNRSLADRLGLALELLRWETHVAPDVGIPQRLILQQLPPEEWDIFVGILWHRFGSETGEIDPETHQLYWSGTEQEFKAAYRLRQESSTGWPKVMFYRCIRPPATIRDVDTEQLARVNQFFAQFAPTGLHPGLVQSYTNPEEFERLVREHLTTWLWEFPRPPAPEGHSLVVTNDRNLSASEVQSSAPSSTPIPSSLLLQMSVPELRQLICDHLTMGEVQTLYFDLGEGRVVISDEEEKNDKITKLLDKLGKYKPSRIPEVTAWIGRNRPDLCVESPPPPRPEPRSPETLSSSQPGKLRVFLCSRRGLFVFVPMTVILVIGVYCYLSNYYKIPIPAFLFFLFLLPSLVALLHTYLFSP